MSPSANISWEDLHGLFSIVMCIDESMSIVYASATLRKHVPQVGAAPKLDEVFHALRPAALLTFDDGVNALGSLCLMTARDGKFAIRGQLIRSRFEGRNVLCLCGAPWLFWINSNCPETPLGLTDFSAQDVQLDQLFFMSTERKMVEDLEEINNDLSTAKCQLEETQKAQKQFFAQMSHEIRTPLNGVVSALALLEACPTDSQQSQFVDLAQRSSQNLMHVINYVLSVSKLELSGDQEQLVFSWPELIRSTVDIVRAKAQEKVLELKLELDPDLPRACYGFPAMFRQTLLNLLINAIKFTEEGVITLRAMPMSVAAESGILRLEVSDTGAGIPDDQLAHIFDPFWSKVPEGISQQEEGTGLGLDIVRRNVQSMGGEIKLESTVGKGTTFWFELPVTLPQGEELEAEDDQLQSHEEVHELCGKVMLVDDNETNLLLGSLVLESLGLKITSVNCGAAAVAAAIPGDFDLVLMDISMPDIDGLEATRQIRVSLGSDELPIVALTAHIDRAERQACIEVGMNGYLTKPILKGALSKELARWLSRDRVDATRKCAGTLSHEEAGQPTELLEASVLDDLVQQIGLDNLQIVIDKLNTEVIQRWSELELAQLENNREVVKRNVHSLASIFRSVGLMHVGDCMGAIEEQLKAGDEPADGWLQTLLPMRVSSLKALNQKLMAL